MKFKLSILTFSFLLLVLSCNDADLSSIGNPMIPMPPPNIIYKNPLNPGIPLPSTLKLTTSTALMSDLKTAVSAIKGDPGKYWGTLDNGIRYTDFSTSSLPQQARYFKYVNAIEPSVDYVPLTEIEFKTYVNSELPKLGLSLEFNRYVERTMNYVYILDSQNKTFQNFKAYLQGQMSTLIRNTNLTELERFALMQMLNGLLVQVEYSYNNPTPANAGGRTNGGNCLPQTKEEWKAVAESAFSAGVAGGISLGLQGVKAGAAATSAAGNPLVGGVVGGGIGFVTGFLGGALVGGGARVMFECAWNKLVGGNVNVYECSGKMIYSWAASPPVGCTSGVGAIITTPADIPDAVKRSLTSIYDFGVVTMPGRAYSSSLITNINNLLRLLNQ